MRFGWNGMDYSRIEGGDVVMVLEALEYGAVGECDRGAEAVVRWGGSAWVDGGGWEGGF